MPLFMPLLGLLYFLVLLGITVFILVVLWRAMKAHEEIARGVGGIEHALSSPREEPSSRRDEP